MIDEKKSIFDLIDKFGGYDANFKDKWTENDFGINNNGPIILNGKWTKDEGGKNVITNATLGEVVYFHLSAQNISNVQSLKIKLYESDYPFGKNHIYSTTVSIDKGKAKVKLMLDTNWKKYINEDIGNQIELFWIINYNKSDFDLGSILNVSEDPYFTAIIDNRYRYSCNCGWIDKTHAFGGTQRNRIDIGAKNLWKQILEEKGTKSVWKNGFMVTYTQDAQVGPITSGVTKNYFIKYGLALKIKEKIALSIFQEVSLEFEEKQALGIIIGRGASSFEPADLVSNLLGFYSVLRPNLTEKIILKKCNELNKEKSLEIYKKYPGTFTLSQYKNVKFTPRFFKNDNCQNPIFPKEFQEIQPYKKDEINFRDWFELFDTYNGIPPTNYITRW
jgi:hypothetical protein